MHKLLHAIVFVISLAVSYQTHAQTFAFCGSSGTAAMTLYFSDETSEIVGAAHQGWWSATQANFQGNTNVITGSCFGIQWNDFFVFDLKSHSGTIVSASLDMNTWSVAGSPIVSLWDVSTPLATLENLNAAPNAAIYADLGSGTRFSGGYTLIGSNTDVVIPLDTAGIAAVSRAMGGSFASGGSANLPIPEPSAVWLLAIALAGLGVIRFRGRYWGRQTAKRSALSYASFSTAWLSRT
jgi:hypothetical protein